MAFWIADLVREIRDNVIAILLIAYAFALFGWPLLTMSGH